MKMRFLAGLAGSSLAAMAAAAPALAQNTQPSQVQPPAQPPAASEEEDEDEIVITGTQIRGIAPAGKPVIGLSAEEVQATGATSGLDLLSRVPQIVNAFQGLPSPGNNNPIGAERSAVTRPNLRNIPNLNNSSGPLTLVIVDGHRMVPQGITVSLVDPESVPASLLARVEVLPDGASGVYGSDAVAGVINYITRDRFDGVEVTGRAGFAKNYWSYDSSLTAGHSWGTGGIFVATTFTKHDWLLGRERDYIAGLDYNPASPTYLQGATLTCDNPNVSVSVRNYPLTAPGGTVQPFTTNGGTAAGGGGNRCDISDYLSVYPKSQRVSLTVGLTQELNDHLRIDLRVWWQKRQNEYTSGPFVSSASIARTNPNYRSLSGVAGAVPADFAGCDVVPRAATCPSQTVRFAYTPLGNTANSRELDASWWQVSPRVTWKISNDWQLRTDASYGVSHTISRVQIIDPVFSASRIAAGIINPYNIGGSAAGAFDNLVQTTRRYGDFQFTDLRAVADGSLFSLPGGDVRAAVGAEYMKTIFTTNTATTPTYQYGPERKASQSVKSVFAELQVPIVGEDNAMPFLHTLALSGSVRHDKYSDFGGTTNYSVGATLAPVKWMKFRGGTGTSFSAPTPVDVLGVDTVALVPLPVTSGAVPNFPGSPGTLPLTGFALFLNGGTVGKAPGDPVLGPQSSKNWSLGFDMDPPFIPGLTLSGTLYNIKIKDQMGFPGVGSIQSVINTFPNLIFCSNYPAVSNPAACAVPLSPALVQQFVNAVDPGSLAVSAGGFPAYNTIAAGVAAGTIPIVYVVEGRIRNLGRVFVRGLDFSARYRHRTGWGGFDAGFSGNHELRRKIDNGPGTSIVDVGRCDNPLWRWTADIGANVGGFRAQATWQHTGGYDICNPGSPGNGITGATAPFGQTKVGAFDTVNLFFKYEFGGDDVFTRDLSLTLNIDNLFNTDPPFLASGNGFSPVNGISLGRFFQIGLTKRFR